MEVLLAAPHRPCCQSQLSSAAETVALHLNLVCLRTCLLAVLARGLGLSSGLSNP